jgi:probable HAF family extracellular repeat protein
LPISEEEMKKWNLSAMVSVLSALLCLAASGAAYSGGKMIDLGTLPGNWGSFEPHSRATAINMNGQIVGWAEKDSYPYYTFVLYSSGSIRDIGVPPGGWDPGEVHGINIKGQIVGYVLNSGNPSACLYSEEKWTMGLGNLGIAVSKAYDINDNGQIVGYSKNASGYEHAFLYSGGTMIDLGALGTQPNITSSEATGINNKGQIVGWSQITAFGAPHVFLYSEGKMMDLGLYANKSTLYRINDCGQIVGTLRTSSGDRAVLYSGGTWTELGTLGGTDSYGVGINNIGQVVGYSRTASGYTHAFLYFRGKMTDLGTLGGQASLASGINNNGQIVGQAVIPNLGGADNWVYHAFLYNSPPIPFSGPGILPLLLGD